MQINQILIKPCVTEKSLNSKKSSIYVFEVAERATKNNIKEAVETVFKVKVGQVKTTIRKGKKKRVGRRMKTKKLSNVKIAYVKVKEGKIDLFPEK